MQSLHENSKAIPPVETSQPTETTKKVIHRLYPSLPNGDGYDLCEGGNHRPAAELHLDRPQEVPQAGDSPPSSDVRLKAQILFLEEQRKQLLSINERWAMEYRTMVHYYKDKIRVLKASGEHEEEKRDKGQKHTALVKKQKVQLVTGGDDSQTERSRSDLEAEKETEELRLQNHTLTRRGQHQHEEIRRLNKALEEARQTPQTESVSAEESPNIWQHQAQVYKEDFFTERKDREKLKEKNMELEKRFLKVYNELQVLKSQVTKVVKPQPGLCCCCHAPDRNPNWDVHQANQHYVQKQRRHTLNAKQ